MFTSTSTVMHKETGGIAWVIVNPCTTRVQEAGKLTNTTQNKYLALQFSPKNE